ncbi:restriction endonuclease subunit S [Jannaschia sp. W003]|uniref:restriction endonuclease subunit S n=1 Tax=Jannaschia sp. W003 TaxID=2867012 RepID=UPI0021A5DF1D|nr:restriction endonuclease subunit S [Jannaschia sp. W003]UWQ20124.1 restriction endonuclease subunit S [Jannaschia sp. W003]
MSELPEGWASTRIGELTSKIGSGATPRGGAKAYKLSGTPLLRSLNIHFDGVRDEGIAYIDDEQAAKLDNVEVETSDVLLNITGASIGRVAIAPERYKGARVNQHVAIIRTVDGVVPSFLSRYLASPDAQSRIFTENYGVTRQALTKGMIEDFPVSLPPLPEQRRIVAKLDRLSARSAAARDHLARTAKLATRAKQAVLRNAFAGSITERWRAARMVPPVATDRDGIDGRVPDLGDIPSAWGWRAVSSICEVSGGLTKNRARADMPRKAPYLRVANVYANELRLDEVTEIGCTKADIERTLLQAGDLLVVEGNGSQDQIGRVAVWTGEVDGCLHQNHLIRVRPKPSVSSAFLLYWMLSPNGRTAIETVASSSSGLHTLSLSKVKGMPVPLCSKMEQAEIVRRIEAAFARIDRVTKEASRAAHLLDRLDERLLARAFRGELVPQDPDDEPAEALLARIREARAAAPKPKRGRRKAST